MMMRIEMTVSGESTLIYIVNGALKKAWMSSGGQWFDISYEDQWDNWDSTWQGYWDNLEGWNSLAGSDLTYNVPGGGTMRIYNISANAALSDSLFQR